MIGRVYARKRLQRIFFYRREKREHDWLHPLGWTVFISFDWHHQFASELDQNNFEFHSILVIGCSVTNSSGSIFGWNHRPTPCLISRLCLPQSWPGRVRHILWRRFNSDSSGRSSADVSCWQTWHPDHGTVPLTSEEEGIGTHGHLLAEESMTTTSVAAMTTLIFYPLVLLGQRASAMSGPNRRHQVKKKCRPQLLLSSSMQRALMGSTGGC